MRPLVMGIVNVTPDSFSDGGLHDRPSAAIDHARRLVAEGADIVDIGGESTRPGAEAVDADTELARILPVVEALSGDVRVSVDTGKEVVARAAIDAGATLINDVTASLAPVAAERSVGWIAMHMQGEPRTMQADPRYDDVVEDVTGFLLTRARAARVAGVGEVWIDPGIGFGKTAVHNWALLAALPGLVASGWPVAVGTSRKAFLGALVGRAGGNDEPAPVHDRVEASVATAVRAAMDGVGLLRVHDVAATVGALRAVAA